MPDSSSSQELSVDSEPGSRFTWRDLKNLSRSSTSCPLRVIALIDFDAFYAQCETVRLGLPVDQPLAVQQWNAVIALNYAAKARGLRRVITPDEAKLKCPEIVLQHVATWREGDSSWAYRSDVKQHMKTDKAALDPYRLQSRKAFELIKSKLPPSPVQKVEKASIDEVFLDLSAQVHGLLLERYPQALVEGLHADLDLALPMPPTTILDWGSDRLVAADCEEEVSAPDWDDVALSIGSEIVRGIRHHVHKEMHYSCSAGIARNKTIAKLAAGHNKPNQQTIIRSRAITAFYSGYRFTKIRGLGGKLGQQVVQAFDTDQTTELLCVSLQDMRSKLGAESGTWVFNVVRGIEYSEVVERTQLQSMLAAKRFVPKAKDLEQAEKWLRIFAGDLLGRLQEQDATSTHRRPRVIALHHSVEGRFGPTRSKQMQIPLGAEITAQLLFDLSRSLLIQISHEGPSFPCLGLSVSISDFEESSSGNRHVTSYFVPKDSDGLQAGCHSTKQHKRGLSSDTAPFDTRLSTSDKRQRLNISDYSRPGEVSTVIDERKVDNESLQANSASPYCCPKCNRKIDGAEVLEHLDWHVAEELQDD